MKVYCQFLVESTGYIQGTIPPQFSKEHVKPIDLVGSSGVMVLDGRKHLFRLLLDCIEASRSHINSSSIIGFKIVKHHTFTNDEKYVIATKLFKDYKV